MVDGTEALSTADPTLATRARPTIGYKSIPQETDTIWYGLPIFVLTRIARRAVWTAGFITLSQASRTRTQFLSQGRRLPLRGSLKPRSAVRVDICLHQSQLLSLSCPRPKLHQSRACQGHTGEVGRSPARASRRATSPPWQSSSSRISCEAEGGVLGYTERVGLWQRDEIDHSL